MGSSCMGLIYVTRTHQGRRHQFLRRKNGVAGILTYERVASYIESFHLEASAGDA